MNQLQMSHFICTITRLVSHTMVRPMRPVLFIFQEGLYPLFRDDFYGRAFNGLDAQFGWFAGEVGFEDTDEVARVAKPDVLFFVIVYYEKPQAAGFHKVDIGICGTFHLEVFVPFQGNGPFRQFDDIFHIG